MRYRKLTSSGDYTFGGGQRDFFINQPEAVAQAVLTRLNLWLSEWFLDTRDGMNWLTGVLGNNTGGTRDALVKARILDTPGVNSIISYQSQFDSNSRIFRVQISLDTIYGVVPPFLITGIAAVTSVQPPL